MSLILVDDSLREICRRGRFCGAIGREFRAPKEDRNLTAEHPYVLFAHCMWCTNADQKNMIAEIGDCINHYVTFINYSEPVPPMLSADPTDAAAVTEATQPGEKPRENIAVLAILLSLYSVLICVGLFSNLLVAVILVRNRAFTNITNLFVLALSLSDILICGMLMPALVFHDMTTRNYLTLSLPRTLYCKFFLISLNVPIYASCLIILWISVDRYRIICHPHRSRMTQRQARYLLLFTVFLGLLVHSPIIAFNTVDKHRDYGCAERWPDKELRLAYSISAFCLQFCTPLIVTGVLYFRIYRRLTERVLRRRDVERKRRTNKILISIVISFAFFWSPWSIFNVISEVEQYRKNSPEKLANFLDCISVTKSWDAINANMHSTFNSEGESIVQASWNLYELFVRLFALGSACVNPYLYGWLNEHVRASLKACLGRSSDSGAAGQAGRRGVNDNSRHRRIAGSQDPDDTLYPAGDDAAEDDNLDDASRDCDDGRRRDCERHQCTSDLSAAITTVVKVKNLEEKEKEDDAGPEAALVIIDGGKSCELMMTHRPQQSPILTPQHIDEIGERETAAD